MHGQLQAGLVRRRRGLGLLAAVGVTALGVLCSVGQPASAAGDGVAAQGQKLVDPDRGTNAHIAGEPSSAVTPDGVVWVIANAGSYLAGSPNFPCCGLGTSVWRSTDAGQTYKWVADPFALIDSGTSTDRTVVGNGGGDVDIAIAPIRNSRGVFNVYVTTESYQGPKVAVSTDGGVSWQPMPDPAVTMLYRDRPWLAADGPCTAYLTMRATVDTYPESIVRYDGCGLPDVAGQTTFTATASPVPGYIANGATDGGTPSLTWGKTVVDSSPTSPYRGSLYIPEIECLRDGVADMVTETVTRLGGCGSGYYQARVLFTRNPGATTPTWSEVFIPGTTAPHTGVYPSVAVDATGRLSFVWSDGADPNGAALQQSDTKLHFSSSADGGQSWRSEVSLVTGKPHSVMPVVASRGSQTAVAFYATPDDDVTAGSEWRPYVASVSATGQLGPIQAGPVVHRGPVSLNGDTGEAGTAYPNSVRDLFECFGLVLPRPGHAAVAYTSDQSGDANNGTLAGDFIGAMLVGLDG